MNIKKLYELRNRQQAKLYDLKADYEKKKMECDSMRENLPQVLIDKGQDDADKMAEDLNKLSISLEALETAIHQLEGDGCVFYTDGDVLEGYRDYVKDFNVQFTKLRKSYLKCFDEAFVIFKKMVQLRRSAKSMREDFIYHLKDKSLIDRDTPLETLNIRNKTSKDSVGNFATYYGDPNSLPTIQEYGNDVSVF